MTTRSNNNTHQELRRQVMDTKIWIRNHLATWFKIAFTCRLISCGIENQILTWDWALSFRCSLRTAADACMMWMLRVSLSMRENELIGHGQRKRRMTASWLREINNVIVRPPDFSHSLHTGIRLTTGSQSGLNKCSSNRLVMDESRP